MLIEVPQKTTHASMPCGQKPFASAITDQQAALIATKVAEAIVRELTQHFSVMLMGCEHVLGAAVAAAIMQVHTEGNTERSADADVDAPDDGMPASPRTENEAHEPPHEMDHPHHDRQRGDRRDVASGDQRVQKYYAGKAVAANRRTVALKPADILRKSRTISLPHVSISDEAPGKVDSVNALQARTRKDAASHQSATSKDAALSCSCPPSVQRPKEPRPIPGSSMVGQRRMARIVEDPSEEPHVSSERSTDYSLSSWDSAR